MAACALAVTIFFPSFAEEEGQTAWAQRLREDAQRFHDVLRDNHPGAVDAENPGFNATLERALRTAMQRADATRDLGGYWWAMSELQAAFDDGHVGMYWAKQDERPQWQRRWPGFLTRFDGERQVVATREEQDATLPSIGATLVSCDGIQADALALERVGRFHGRWMLESQRASHGSSVFIDDANPWTKLPRECVFDAQGRKLKVALQWRDIDDAAYAARRAQARSLARAGIGVQRLADGTTWISLGTFNGDPNADTHPALTALVETVKAQVATIRQGPVVFDVRGNAGGSSHWSRQISEILWGEAAVQRATRGSEAVDWRVSEGNIAYIRKFRDSLRAMEAPDPEILAWASGVVEGMESAQKQGLALWRQTDDEDEAQPETPPAEASPAWPSPRAYVLTDSACASACLDAMDLWKGLGVVQVGRETSADTQYMEVRGEKLPSGLTVAAVPTKVYRGRPRAGNQAYRPDFIFDGDMADSAALQAWVAGLSIP